MMPVFLFALRKYGDTRGYFVTRNAVIETSSKKKCSDCYNETRWWVAKDLIGTWKKTIVMIRYNKGEKVWLD